jgi:urea transporter
VELCAVFQNFAVHIFSSQFHQSMLRFSTDNGHHIDYANPKDLYTEIFLSGSMSTTQELLVLYSYGILSKRVDRFTNALAWCGLIIDVVLRGIAQVFLCNHPISGIFICIGLAFTSFEMLGYSLLTTALATYSALIVATAPKDDVLAGLCGYDGALVGCACYAFLHPSYNLAAAILLSLLSGVVHVACANILSAWSLPTFTFSFNIVTVLILLAIHGGVVSLDRNDAAPAHHPDSFTNMSLMFVIDASIQGVGQFMFADTTVGSAFVIAGIAIASRQGAFGATLGATVGWIVALYILKVKNVVAIRTGLFGYNCAGTCASLAGGVFFRRFDMQTVIVGIVGACLCSLLTVGIVGILQPLPCLTFPFITTTWIMLVTRTSWLSNDVSNKFDSQDVGKSTSYNKVSADTECMIEDGPSTIHAVIQTDDGGLELLKNEN